MFIAPAQNPTKRRTRMAVRAKTPLSSEQELVIHNTHTTVMKMIVLEIKTSFLQGA
jgi:hypothetical protein